MLHNLFISHGLCDIGYDIFSSHPGVFKGIVGHVPGMMSVRNIDQIIWTILYGPYIMVSLCPLVDIVYDLSNDLSFESIWSNG